MTRTASLMEGNAMSRYSVRKVYRTDVVEERDFASYSEAEAYAESYRRRGHGAEVEDGDGTPISRYSARAATLLATEGSKPAQVCPNCRSVLEVTRLTDSGLCAQCDYWATLAEAGR